MSRTRKFLGGLSLGFVNQALLTLVALWLTPFLLHRIQQHDYGLWLLATQILAYLLLLDFGIVALIPRSTAYATGRAGGFERAADLPQILGHKARLVLWQMPLVIGAAVLLWYFIPAEWEALRRPLFFIIAVFVLSFPFRIFQAVLQGLQDLSFLAAAQICIWLVSTALTITLVLYGFRLYALVIGWAVGQLLLPMVLFYRLCTRFQGVLPRRLPALSWLTARSYLREGFWVSLAQIAQVMLNGTDLLIIGKLLGPIAVVPYVCTSKLISVLTNQPQMVMQSAFPALSEMRMGESRERLFEVCTALSLAMLVLSGGVTCAVLISNRGFVTWWIGTEQYAGLSLTSLLLLSMLLRHWNTTWIYTMLCFGYERRISLTNLLDGVVNVSTTIFLVWAIGLKGGPLGTIIGACVVSIPANLSALARAVEVSRSTLLLTAWPWFWRFTCLVLISGIIGMAWVPNTFLMLALTAISAAVVYFVVMMPVMLNSSLGIYIRPRLNFIRMKLWGEPHPDSLT
jgi:O-antigen/teichoic acid export membrane protein